MTSVSGWYDVKDYGAVGDGSTDDYTHIQDAVAACIAGGGGDVYYPHGQYFTSQAISVDTSASGVPVYMHGVAAAGGENVNGTGGATLVLGQNPNGGGTVYGVNALGGGTGSASIFRMTDLTMVTAETCTDLASDFEMIHCQDMVNAYFERVQMFENHNVSGQVIVGTVANTGLRIINAFGAWVDQCELLGNMNALWMDSTQQLFATNGFASSFAANDGSVCVRVDDATNRNGSGTIQMTNLATFGGGYGLYGKTYSGNNVNPAFFYANDLQINNPSEGGIYLQSGAGVWLDYAWVSLEHPTNGVAHGIELDTGFEGTFYMVNSTVQSPSGHGIYARGGTGYAILASSFGGCGHGSPNTYDDIHIASTVSNVSITGNHFDTDVAQGINGARSAIYAETGASNVNVTGNIFPASGYHTAPLIDYTHGSITGGCNTNVQLAVEGWQPIILDGGWNENPSYAAPRYRIDDNGNIQLNGAAYRAAWSGGKALNSANPIPAPAYDCDYYSSDSVGNRCHVSLHTDGILYAYVPAGGTGNWYAEINGTVPFT